MATALDGLIGRIRRPEYTGENRCIPCTLVNLALAIFAAAGSALILLILDIDVMIVGGVAGLIVASSAVAIYLRGYLVPGTPRLTRSYFPDRLLRLFDKQSVPTKEGEFDTEAFLKGVDAVEECVDEDDLCLTGGFREAWKDRIEVLRQQDTSREDLASILGIDPSRLEVEDHGAAFVARADGARMGQWESRAAFLADVGAANELRARYGGWSGIDVERRGQVLNGLRLFLEECPTCGGPVTLQGDVVESCCRSIDVVAVTCETCDARLFEAEHPA